MELSEWIDNLKGKKMLTDIQVIKLQRELKIVRRDNNIIAIVRLSVCRCCRRSLGKKVVVEFKNAPHHFSIFQSYLLFCLFGLDRKPYDYANYHNCVAGREFIQNIKDITVEEV